MRDIFPGPCKADPTEVWLKFFCMLTESVDPFLCLSRINNCLDDCDIMLDAYCFYPVIVFLINRSEKNLMYED